MGGHLHDPEASESYLITKQPRLKDAAEVVLYSCSIGSVVRAAPVVIPVVDAALSVVWIATEVVPTGGPPNMTASFSKVVSARDSNIFPSPIDHAMAVVR